MYHANSNHKKSGLAILISDKMDFKIIMLLQKKKRGTFYNDKRIKQAYITIINIHASNNRTPKYMKQRLGISFKLSMSRSFPSYYKEFLNID